MKALRVLLIIATGISLMGTLVQDAQAQRLSFIRDSEIENNIRLFATPVFRAAGLNPDSIRVHLVRDNNLNAFVAGGMQMFINTGLIQSAETAEQLIGVIAHETGHISGGHLSRTREALRNASRENIVGMVLGGAAAILSGRADVGAAVLGGGTSTGTASFLQYSRTQESAADQAAARYMDIAGISSQGLLEFMSQLEDQELVSARFQNPYVRTHPMTRERITFLRQHVAVSPATGNVLPDHIQQRHQRMRAKLYAYLFPANRTLARYPETNQSLEARYARAIAHLQSKDLDTGLPLIDALIAENPEDPYFQEVKGQALFESGRLEEALPAYQKAADILKGSPLVLRELARLQVTIQDPALLEDAIRNFRASLAIERNSAGTWRQLAIAYGRNGQDTESSLALAEEAMLRGEFNDAEFLAGRAERTAATGSRQWLQAQDIKAAAQNAKEARNR